MLVKYHGRWYRISAKVAIRSTALIGSAVPLLIGLALVFRDLGVIGASLFIGALVGLPLITLITIFTITVHDQLKNPQQFITAADEIEEQALSLKRLQKLQ